MPVEKGVECAIESHEGRGIRPPRDREVNHREKFGRQPRQRNRNERQEERNNPAFVRVCAIAVHTSPARLVGAEQALWACELRFTPEVASERHRRKEPALSFKWLPEDGIRWCPKSMQLVDVSASIPFRILAFEERLDGSFATDSSI